MKKIVKKPKYCFYILKCKDKTLYCGITIDLAHREKLHNAGQGSAYVRSRGGGKIVYSEKQKSLSTALRREIEVKRFTRAKKLILVRSNTNLHKSMK